MPENKPKTKTRPETADGSSPQQQISWVRDYFVTLVVSVLFALFVTTFVAHPMSVPTPSMDPTILVGDRLIVDKFTLRPEANGWKDALFLHRKIRRGDIIVFKFPKDPTVPYVKRLIGLPGDTLQVINKVVHINGKPLDEPYKRHIDPNIYSSPDGSYHEAYRRDNYGPIKIPEKCYFMMGDNRDNSEDSRFWGFVPENLILGRPLFIFWSYDDDPYRQLSAGETAGLYLKRIVNFFNKTRWSRTAHIVR
jgi:signal peptidase I